MNVKIQIEGDKALDDIFRRMPGVFQERVMQNAHARSARHVVNKAKLLAPEGPTGNLVDSIGVVRVSQKRVGGGAVIVGPRRRGKYKGYAGHLVEFGTRMRYTRRSGAYRGFMKPRPFMRPAWEQTRPIVLREIPTEYRSKLLSFLKRRAKA